MSHIKKTPNFDAFLGVRGGQEAPLIDHLDATLKKSSHLTTKKDSEYDLNFRPNIPKC